MAPREIREIVVRVDTPGEQGLKKISDGFAKMNRNISDGTSVLKRFEQIYFRIAGLSFAGLGINAIVQSLDTFQKLNNKLEVTEGSAEGARAALGKIVEVASLTKSSVADITTVYTRLNQSMTELNLGSDAVLGLTLALQNSFRIYGATAAEAQGATIQLSQALSAGGLRGQELRSVMEANGLLAGMLAKKLGIARGELIKWAEKNGGIPTQVILETLSENFQDLADKADKLTPTVGEALTMAFDKAKLAMHKLNQEAGATKFLSDTILGLGNNMGTLLTVVGYAAAAFITYKGAVAAWLALNGAAQLATGIYSAFFALQMISFQALIPLVWSYVAAQAAALAVLGPIGIAIGAVAVAYGIYNGMQREANGHAQRELSNGEKRLRQQDSLYRYMDEKARKEKESEVNLVEINQKTHDFVNTLAEQSMWTQEVTTGIGVYREGLAKAAADMDLKSKAFFNYEKALAKLNGEFGTTGNMTEYKKKLQELDIKKLTQQYEAGKISLVKYKKELNEIMNGKPITSLKEYRGELSELNKQFEVEVRSGNVSNYAEALQQVKLDKLTRDLEQGRASFLEVNKAMRESHITGFNREVVQGSMGLTEYRQNLQAIHLRQINEEWRAGVTDVYAYNKAIVETQDKFAPGSAFFTGTNNYIQQAGTLSQNVANMVTNTFQNLENTMVDFAKTGKFAFKDFAMAVLEDLNRIIIRSLIIRPLAQGILSAIPTGAGASASMESQNGLGANNEALAAKGAYFSGKASYFAKGGLVSGATPFSYGGGKAGVMGEKGPEAIMPLKRTPSGDLGVQSAPSAPVIVNITNNAGGEVEQSESKGPNGERILDIIINKKVKEAFANGSMDKQMSQNYGLRRKGI